MSSPRAWPRMGVMVSIWVALVTASFLVAASADEYVIFTWGSRYRILSHEVDFEGGRMKLVLGPESFMDIPLDSVAKILNADREVVLDLTLSGALMDAWDPPDASLWSPHEGWSSEEVWTPGWSQPLWAFRWTTSETAQALIWGPPVGTDAIELRLLSISHTIRVLGRVPAPELQFLRVSLNGELLGELALENGGWRTYQLALPGECRAGPALLQLETSYVARPTEFTNGLSQDSRELGVAVDYVRFVSSQGNQSTQGNESKR